MTGKKPPDTGFQKVKAFASRSIREIIQKSHQVYSDIIRFFNRPLIRLSWFWRKNRISLFGLLFALFAAAILSSAFLDAYFQRKTLQFQKEYQEIHRQFEMIHRLQDQINKLEKKVKKITIERAKLKALGGTTGKYGSYPTGACAPVSLLFPIRGGFVIQYWSEEHPAIDIAVSYGTPIYSAGSGYVALANSTSVSSGYGIGVFVNIGGGEQLRYAHLSRTDLNIGDYVRKGEVIGFVGATGNATGAHLHFEFLCSGNRINPFKYL